MRGSIKFDKALVFRVRGVRISLAAAILLSALAALLIIAQAFCLSTVISGVFLGGRTLRQVWGILLVLIPSLWFLFHIFKAQQSVPPVHEKEVQGV